jgi:signal transduction histidine kinase
LYRRLLSATPLIVDEHGVPFALYAARRMLERREPEAGELTAVLEVLGAISTSSRPSAPAAVFMMRDVAETLAMRFAGSTNAEAASALVRSIETMARDLEQALALQEAFPALAARFSASADQGANPVWAPFGGRPSTWLVALAPPGEPVVAIRTERLLASLPAVREHSLNIAVNASGEALGPEFPGLSVSFAGGATDVPAGPSMLQRSFYITVLVVVVSMTLLGAYLFWRDVRREVALAELRSQFVSSVSHELKTPLTAIRMFAETLLLGRSERPATHEEYLETIVNESERLTRLLNNVLDFSKIEQGKKLYRLEPHSLGAIVRSAARTMHYPLSQQGFDLRVSVDDRLPPVASDADAMEQAILNLLSNAMKYSGQSRSIDLQARRDGDCARVSVTDRGLGIPPHEQGRIFEKFYRIGGAEREGIPGTGLGLTLVEHVARGHGGEVKVDSVPAEGSTFSIFLPLLPASAGAAPPKEALA